MAPQQAAAPVLSQDVTRPTRRVGILSVSGYLPPQILTNADLEAMVETSDQWITERTGIQRRHQTSEAETASTFGVIAARQALTAAGDPSIDAMVTACCSPDTLLPSVSCLMQPQLGFAGIPAFD